MSKLEGVNLITIEAYKVFPSTIVEGTERAVNLYYPTVEAAIKNYIEEATKNGVSKRLGHNIKVESHVVFNPAKITLYPGSYQIVTLVMDVEEYMNWDISEDANILRI